MSYHDEKTLQDYCKEKDVYLTCCPIYYKFRKLWVINYFGVDKKEAESETFFELPVEEPEHLMMLTFMSDIEFTEKDVLKSKNTRENTQEDTSKLF